VCVCVCVWICLFVCVLYAFVTCHVPGKWAKAQDQGPRPKSQNRSGAGPGCLVLLVKLPKIANVNRAGQEHEGRQAGSGNTNNSSSSSSNSNMTGNSPSPSGLANRLFHSLRYVANYFRKSSY